MFTKKDLGICGIRGLALCGSLKCKPKLPISYFKHHVDFEILASTYKRQGFKAASNTQPWLPLFVFKIPKNATCLHKLYFKSFACATYAPMPNSFCKTRCLIFL